MLLGLFLKVWVLFKILNKTTYTKCLIRNVRLIIYLNFKCQHGLKKVKAKPYSTTKVSKKITFIKTTKNCLIGRFLQTKYQCIS